MIPLTNKQTNIFISCCLYPDKPLFNIGGCIKINGEIDDLCLEKSIYMLISEQSALRTRITMIDNTPYQHVIDNHDFKLSCQTMEQSCFDLFLAEKFKDVIQLINSPLYDIELCRFSKQEAALIIKLHHIISDGWSMTIIARQIDYYYRYLQSGKDIDIETYSFQDSLQKNEKYLNTKLAEISA